MILKKLTTFFEDDDNVLMAFLFGSYSKGSNRNGSDVDIAVYLKKIDDKIIKDLWSSLEDHLKNDVDLIILNNAKPAVAWESIKGKKIVIRDQKLYNEFMLRISLEAEDFRNTSNEIYKLKEQRKQ